MNCTVNRILRGAFQAPTLVLLFASLASASDYEQGKVHLGNGRWATPETAEAEGYFEYHGRWFPETMKKTLRKWEKQDLKHASWRTARRFTTKHYRVITNVPRFICETEIKPFLDSLYRTYVRVFKERFGLKSKAANKKLIHIHDGYEDFAAMNMEGSRPHPRANPGFIIGGSTLVTYYDETEPEMFYSSVFHEGAHQFVSAVLPGAQFPRWIDEALATYFEGFSYSRSKRTVNVNFLPPVRLVLAKRLLREKRSDGGPRWDLYEVLNAPDAEFNARHYALAWSFAYFMTHAEEGKRRTAFSRFLREMNRAGLKFTPEQIFTRVCKEDPLALEPQWRAFVLGLEGRRMPETPILTNLGRNKAGLDLQKGDWIRSFDYHRITSVAQFAGLWKARPRDRELRLVVVRHKPVPGVRQYEASRILVTIPPNAAIQLETLGLVSLEPSIAD